MKTSINSTYLALGALVLSLSAMPMVAGSARAQTVADDVVCSLCVNDTDIAPDSVGTAKIKDKSVQDVDLAPDSVGGAKIKDGSVAASDLSSDVPLALVVEDSLGQNVGHFVAPGSVIVSSGGGAAAQIAVSTTALQGIAGSEAFFLTDDCTGGAFTIVPTPAILENGSLVDDNVLIATGSASGTPLESFVDKTGDTVANCTDIATTPALARLLNQPVVANVSVAFPGPYSVSP